MTFLILLSSLFIGNFAMAASCETVGFVSKDGTFVPVLKCTGISSSSEVSNSNLNGSGNTQFVRPHYSGSPSSGAASGRQDNFLPEPPKTSFKIIPEDAKASLTQSVGQSFLSPQVTVLNSKALNDSLKELSNNIAKTYVNNIATSFSSLDQAAQTNRNMFAAMNAWNTVINNSIYRSIQAQIEIENKFSKENEVVHATAVELLQSEITNDQETLENFDNSELVIETHSSQTTLSRQGNDALEYIRNDLPNNELSQQVLLTSEASVSLADSSHVNRETRLNAVGALAMSTAAAEAIKAGNPVVADQYLKLAAYALDISLGLVSSLSPVNDLTQIAFGIATGQDYAGNPMEASDYALRGLSIVLTLYPAAKLGSVALDMAFVIGSKVTREAGVNSQTFSNILKTGKNFAAYVQVLGSLAPKSIKEFILYTRGTNLVSALFEHAADLSARIPKSELSQVLSILKNGSYSLKDRWDIITSFKPGTLRLLEVPAETRLYRWSTDGGIGRYFSNELVQDAEVARKMLALPVENEMRYLREYKMSANGFALVGEVAPNFSNPGGGTQLFVIDFGKIIFTKDIR